MLRLNAEEKLLYLTDDVHDLVLDRNFPIGEGVDVFEAMVGGHPHIMENLLHKFPAGCFSESDHTDFVFLFFGLELDWDVHSVCGLVGCCRGA